MTKLGDTWRGMSFLSGFKVFIDILTPKQCMLFSKLSQNWRGRGMRFLKRLENTVRWFNSFA